MNIEKQEWPDNYPHCLLRYSWTLGEIAGPHKWWTKHCKAPYGQKNSPYFWKSLLVDLFGKQGVSISSEIEHLLDYYCKCFTIYFKDDEFIMSTKKKDVNGRKKMIFDKKEYARIAADCGLNARQATEMMHYITEQSLAFYNRLIVK